MRTLASFLLCAALSATTLLSAADPARNDDHTVTVQATAITKGPPDKLELFLEIRAVRPVMKESLAAVNASRQRLLGALKILGIPDDGLQILDVEQGRETEWTERRRLFKGYFAATGVILTLRDSAKLPLVQNEILSDELIEVKGMSRSSDREGELRRKALADAAEAARKKAEILATTLGAKLGPVIAITETSYESRPRYGNAMANMVQTSSGDEDDAPVKEIAVHASITVRFALQP